MSDCTINSKVKNQQLLLNLFLQYVNSFRATPFKKISKTIDFSLQGRQYEFPKLHFFRIKRALQRCLKSVKGFVCAIWHSNLPFCTALLIKRDNHLSKTYIYLNSDWKIPRYVTYLMFISYISWITMILSFVNICCIFLWLLKRA